MSLRDPEQPAASRALRPPRLATALLERLLPEHQREYVLGDLIEEHGRRRRGGSLGSRLWYWREAIRVLLHHARSPYRASNPPRVPRQELAMLSTLFQELHLGVRAHARRPALALAIVLTLAVAIGAVTTIFSVVDAVLLRPLPFRDPAELVTLYDVQEAYGEVPASYPEYLDWRRQASSLEAVAAYFDVAPTFTGSGEPEVLFGYRASADLLPMLGVEPALGRLFSADEEAAGGARVAVLSWALFQRRFGGDAGALGRSIVLDGEPATIVGVLPRWFHDVSPAGSARGRTRDLWLPLALDEEHAPRGLHFLTVLGRLRDGTRLDAARAQLTTMASQLRDSGVSSHDISLVSMHEALTRRARRPLLALVGAVACVLLAACANTANLLLARATERRGEIAVRQALGAGRWRVVRQLLLEGALLAGAAALLGVLLAQGATLLVADSDILAEAGAFGLGVDGRVLAFAMVLTACTTLLFALAPSLQAAMGRTASSLQMAGRPGNAVARARLRAVLVVGEISLSLILMVAAALLGRSFVALLDSNTGFEAARVLAFDLDIGRGAELPAAQRQFFQSILEQIQAVPGVETVGLTNSLPLDGGGTNGGIQIEGRTDPPDSGPQAEKRIVSPGYFATLGIPLIEGRLFEPGDREGSAPVAVVSESFARRYFDGQSPLGRRLSFQWGIDGFQEVIGVVGDVKQYDLAQEPFPTVYVAFQQRPDSTLTVAVRSALPPGDLVPVLRHTVAALAPDVPVVRPRALAAVVDATMDDRRLSLATVSAFAVLGLLLGATGLYGVLSYSVRRRTREIGLRIALGATPAAARALVVGEGLRLVLAGLALGLLGALAVGRVVTSGLYIVSASDPLTLVGVSVLLMLVGLLACWLPARRASRVHPSEALRQD